MENTLLTHTHWEPNIGKANKRAQELEILARCTPLLYNKKTESGILEQAARIVGREMGYPCAVMTPDGDFLCLKYMEAPDQVREGILGISGMEHGLIRFPAACFRIYQKALSEHGPVFESSLDAITANQTSLQPVYWTALSQLLNQNMGNRGVRVICAPVICGDRPIAAINVFGPDLAEEDVPTIQHFVQIVASAIQRLHDLETLEDSQRLLLLRNEIALAFLTGKGHSIYSRVLGILMNATQSWAGTFGYVNEDGDLVFPASCIHDNRRAPAGEAAAVTPRNQWDPLWERAFAQQAPLIHNALLSQPHVGESFTRGILIPIVFDGKHLGVITVGNKDSDYVDEDVLLARTLTEFIAPLLFARLRAETLETQRRESERAQRESEERFRLIADLSPFPVSIIDDLGNYEYINPRFTEIFGYTLEHVPTGRDWFRLAFPNPDVRNEAIGSWKDNLADARGHQVRPQIFTVACRDNSNCIVIFRPLLMKGGKLFVVYEDITDRERAAAEKDSLHKQLLHAQKMEAVGTLAGGIAHDFNNLLAVIIGNAQLATAGLKGHENAEEVEEILKAAQRARDLTMKLLSFSRKEKLNVKSADINVIVRDIVTMIDRSLAGKIRLEMHLENALPPVRVDTNQIHQALLNICTNARDAMPRGGELRIQTLSVNLDNDYCRKHPETSPGPHCLIRVTDTGEGMPDSVRDKIFEPFFTTKSDGKGTGLGLYITYGIIKNHGGHIHVDTAPGKGATIDIYLPHAVSVSESAVPNALAAEQNAGRETILVVDDEKSLLRLAEKMLARDGYRPLTARSGPEALDIFQKKHREIDLVILDMIMPDMDGPDVFRALKAINPGVRVVLVSGYSVEGRASALMAQGVRAFVQKPFNFKDFIGTIRTVLDSGD